MTATQRGVAAGMAGALALTLALTWWCAAGTPGLFLSLGEPSLRQRLVVAAAAWIGPLAALSAAVAVIANRRFFSAQDIDGAGLTLESAGLRVPRAILANTHEQAALAIAVYAGLAIALPTGQLVFPLLLSAAFVVGRLFFAIGYSRGAAARSFGFALTFYPTVAGLIVMALRLARFVGASG
jgi:hypothetical protein